MTTLGNYRKPRKRKCFEFYENEHGCFICTSHSLTKSGHITFRFNNQWYNAHRYIYEECCGRNASGESHGMVKLTEVQVITIRDSSLSWSK